MREGVCNTTTAQPDPAHVQNTQSVRLARDIGTTSCCWAVSWSSPTNTPSTALLSPSTDKKTTHNILKGCSSLFIAIVRV